MNTKRILLVEDHPDDVFLTLHSLKKKAFENITVMNEAAKALEYLGANSYSRVGLPDLIIVDLKLPKMDGFQFIEAVKDNEFTRDIPLVVLSSSVYVREIERCRELGVDVYFSKPLDCEELVSYIKRCTYENGTGGTHVTS